MVILLDMDSVLAQLIDPWLAVYNADYNDCVRPSDITSWKVHEHIKKECGHRVYDYLNEEDWFYNLLPFEDAVGVVKRLEGKHEVFFVTASPYASKTAAFDKQRWMEKYFPFLPKNSLILTHAKGQVRGDILLDDAPHNIENFKYGISCLLDSPWNKGAKCDYKVKSLTEFEVLIQELSSE